MPITALCSNTACKRWEWEAAGIQITSLGKKQAHNRCPSLTRCARLFNAFTFIEFHKI
jgi:hypothetical protein